MKTSDRIMREKFNLLRKHPFFGVQVCRLKIIEDDGTKFQTMATDGQHLWWHDGYVGPLPDIQLLGLLAHETLHITNLHMLRRGTRDPKKWNYACDATIDWMLYEAGFDVPDSFALIPKWAWARGLTAEVIYDRMPKDCEPKPTDKARGGSISDSPAKGDAERGNVEVEVKIAVRQAALAQANSGGGRGDMPGWMKDLIEDVCDPKVPWQDLLRTFTSNHRPSGQTWARPNRKFIHQGMYLPGRLKSGYGELLVYVDTSGSQWSMRGQFFAELRVIVEDLEPQKVHIIQCDAGVGNYVCLEPNAGDFVEPSFVGGGGSDFRPAFLRIAEMGIHPTAAIVLSDMDIAFPVDAPNYPVLGVSTTKRSGPDWMQTVWM